MAVKTITIDLEAYEVLARRKGPGQSFSQVIKEHFGTLTTGRNLKAALATAEVSDESLDDLDRIIACRQESPARAADA